MLVFASASAALSLVFTCFVTYVTSFMYLTYIVKPYNCMSTPFMYSRSTKVGTKKFGSLIVTLYASWTVDAIFQSQLVQ